MYEDHCNVSEWSYILDTSAALSKFVASFVFSFFSSVLFSDTYLAGAWS